jgi:hypothetical protein
MIRFQPFHVRKGCAAIFGRAQSLRFPTSRQCENPNKNGVVSPLLRVHQSRIQVQHPVRTSHTFNALHSTTIMKAIKHTLALCGLTAALCLGSTSAIAQDQGRGQGGPGGRGNFDPEEMRQRMNERMREQFAVTNDDEWKIISERIEKVQEAQRATTTGRGFGFGFGRRGGGGPGGGQQGEGGGRGRGGFGGQASPEVEALQEAIDKNADTDEIKAKLAKVREARKAAEVKLVAAQKDLKEVLNTKQEATAVLMGMLP